MLLNIWTGITKTKYKQYLLLLLLILVGYYPFTFLIYSPDHDFLNCWVPWRHYISQSIQEGYFPWWNPYQQLGYPIHSDLQGPLWYPENMISAHLGIQSVPYLIWIYLLHLWVGAIAVYELCLKFGAKLLPSLFTGVLYVFTGFYLGHSMHQYAIYSAAWIPLLLLFFLRLLEEQKWQWVFWSGFVMFLNLTGGNHTFTIISIYLFGIIWFYYLIKNKNHTDRLIKQLKLTGGYLIACLSVGALVLVLAQDISPFVGRLKHMSYDSAAYNPFSPQSLLSLVNPNININAFEVFKTDQSMSNAYLSILGFLGVLLTFLRKRSTLENGLLFFAIICLLASFGDATPVHKILFDYVPGLGKFRFPSYYTYFTILLLLPLLAKTLSEIKNYSKTKIIIVGVIGLLFTGSQFVYGLLNYSDVQLAIDQYNGSFFQLKNTSNIAFNAFVFGGIGLIITGLYLKFLRTKWVWAILALELLVFVPFSFTHTTMIDHDPLEIQATINANNQPFNQQKLDPISEHNHDKDKLHFFWRNNNNFLKNITNDGYNSNWFWNLYQLEDSIPRFKDVLYKNPVFHLSNKLIDVNEVGTNLEYDSNYTAVQNKDVKEIKGILNDTELAYDLRVVQLNGKYFEFEITSNAPALLNLLQSWYPGWQVRINQNPGKLYKTNFMCMSTIIPKGKSRVLFYYTNPKVLNTAIFSYSAWILCFVLGAVFYKRKL